MTDLDLQEQSAVFSITKIESSRVDSEWINAVLDCHDIAFRAVDDETPVEPALMLLIIKQQQQIEELERRLKEAGI